MLPDRSTSAIRSSSTIGELAAKVIERTGSRQGVRFEPLPADDPRRRRPDIALAEARLGWGPVVQLDNGLDSTIAYFRDVLVA